jgi:hypothetical protein
VMLIVHTLLRESLKVVTVVGTVHSCEWVEVVMMVLRTRWEEDR